MAKFIDEREEEVTLQDGEEVSTVDETDEPEEVEEQLEEDIPEKYQGKDIKDIVRMHQEAEKLLGRQSSEVGELRKIVDDFVQTQLATQQQAHDSTEVDEIDFYTDPQKAVDYAIANHPKIKAAETVTLQMKQQESLAKLRNAHPDFESIIRDEKFGEWVTKSKVRIELLKRADSSYDFDAADELLTTWKERQNIVNEAKETETKSRKETIKKASTGNTKGSAEAPSRKIYRRADIIKLMQTDPDRYQMLAPEIRLAYAEGRVR